MCIHNAIEVNEAGEIIGEITPTEQDKIFTCEEVLTGGGGFCATNSIFAPTKFTKKLPDYFEILAIDLVWQMYLASKGTTYCFQDKMSAYRVASEGSWTQRMRKEKEKYLLHCEKVIRVWGAFDEHTNYKYHASIEKMQVFQQFQIFFSREDFVSLRKPPYRNCGGYKKLGKRNKLKYIFGMCFPIFFQWKKTRK